jgi:arsenite-transporting ATPase
LFHFNQIQFYIGKGGVGKSTISALQALQSSNSGTETLLVSLDPAHNQRDIFEKELSDTPVNVTNNLCIAEPDIDKWIKKYLKESEEKIQANYSYQQAFSIKNYFKLFKYSPTVEEFAMLMALEYYLNNFKAELIIVDMPPTALSLRFFALPVISLKWLDQLFELRKAINKKREIISQLKVGKKELETDKVLSQLSKLKNTYRKFQALFSADSTAINLVANPEKLSLNEAERTIKKISDIELSVSHLILNKLDASKSFLLGNTSLKQLKSLKFYSSSIPLLGLENLTTYLSQLE